MSRRKKPAPRQIVWIDWSQSVAEMFTLVPASWTPPAKVRVQGTRQRSTWSARFRTPAGHINTARVRVEEECATGDLFVVDEKLQFETITFFVPPKRTGYPPQHPDDDSDL